MGACTPASVPRSNCRCIGLCTSIFKKQLQVQRLSVLFGGVSEVGSTHKAAAWELPCIVLPLSLQLNKHLTCDMLQVECPSEGADMPELSHNYSVDPKSGPTGSMSHS